MRTRTTVLLNILIAVAFIGVLHFAPHYGEVLIGAGVTVAAGYPKRDYSNARKTKIWKLDIANTNTLDTGMRATDVEVDADPNSNFTSITKSVVNGQVRLTFATGGAINGVMLRVTARN